MDTWSSAGNTRASSAAISLCRSRPRLGLQVSAPAGGWYAPPWKRYVITARDSRLRTRMSKKPPVWRRDMITTLFSLVVQVRHLAESLTSKIGVSVPAARSSRKR